MLLKRPHFSGAVKGAVEGRVSDCIQMTTSEPAMKLNEVVTSWLVVGWTASGPMQKSIPVWVRIGYASDPLWVRFGSVLLLCGHERGSRSPQPTKWTFTPSLDRYEAQLDQQIEVNNGVTHVRHCI